MPHLLTQAFQKVQTLPEPLQDELAQQLIEDIEQELRWQQTLNQPQPSILEKLARQALQESDEKHTKVMGFDEL
ncbi:MAG: hypothetical protein F6J87_08230 [Spirulina sp. SIO3F2]|nr:hypothetical protein [Spirulina sp. SIO3F2]